MKKFNLKEYMSKVKQRPSKLIYSALMVIFASVFLYSTGFLVVYFINSNKQANQHDELANIVEQVKQDMNTGNNNGNNNNNNNNSNNNNNNNNNNNSNSNSGGNSGSAEVEIPDVLVEITHPKTGDLMDILQEYSTVFQMNTDMVGWIKIPETKLNYPVLQTKEPHYYLKRDFYKQSARHGSIYAHELADVNIPTDNVTLYGHNMADGSMFAVLHKYENQSFYKSHPYIYFDTLTMHQTYKIFAVFYTTDLPDGFAYHDFVDGAEEDFTKFVNECKRLSLYDTGETATYGDELLTLSTCDNDVTDSHGRYVVVAKKISQYSPT